VPYASTKVHVLDHGGSSAFVLADSVTWLGPEANDAVVLTGSHGGAYAALQAAARGPKALIANDAGVGKQEAGIAGLRRLDRHGIAAAAVAHWSARIGDATDTWESGVISYVNALGLRAGVQIGMSAKDAAERLAALHRQPERDRPQAPTDRIRQLVVAHVPVTVLDSASAIDTSMLRHVVVTASHGGLVGGNVIRAPVRAAVFNDAGLGKDGCGIARVLALDELGIPGLAVSHDSARIGDGYDTYTHGLVSAVNLTAQRAGLAAGIGLRAAINVLVGSGSSG
jgi:hypothetical protein